MVSPDPSAVAVTVDALLAEIETRVAAKNAPAGGYRMGARLFSAVRDRLNAETDDDLIAAPRGVPLIYRGVKLVYSMAYVPELEWREA